MQPDDLKRQALMQAEAARAQPLLKQLLERLDVDRDKLGVVGGAVRDWAMGLANHDLDLLWTGDFSDLANAVAKSGLTARVRPDYLTLSVKLHGQVVDIAATRRDTYHLPGAQPLIAPADLETDLRRRDFTANAMAVFWTDGQARLQDPLGGLQDIVDAVARPVGPGTLAEDPVRLLRGARYCARFGWGVSNGWGGELGKAATPDHWRHVAVGRLWREFQLIADEATAIAAYGLISRWGVDCGVFGEALEDETLQHLENWRQKGLEKLKTGKNWLLDVLTIQRTQPTISAHIRTHWQTPESELNRLNKLIGKNQSAAQLDPLLTKIN